MLLKVLQSGIIPYMVFPKIAKIYSIIISEFMNKFKELVKI